MSFAQIVVAFIALIALVVFIEGEYWYFWDKGALIFGGVLGLTIGLQDLIRKSKASKCDGHCHACSNLRNAMRVAARD